MNLQYLIVQPRSGNTRIPKVDSSTRTIGSDGKLYKLVDEADQYKYKIMSEDDILLETRTSKEMAASINAGRKPLAARNQSGGSPRSPRSPRTGRISKEKRIQQNAWKKKVEAEALVVDKSLSTPKPPTKSTSPVKPPPADENTMPSSVVNALSVLQSKYEKNLEVIDLLFQEKKQMEEKVKILETKLSESTNKFENAIGVNTSMESTDGSVLQPPKPAQLSASMAAALFGPNTTISYDVDDISVEETPVSHSFKHRPHSSSAESVPSRHRASSASRGRPLSASTSAIPSTRAASTDSRRSSESRRSFGQSIQMQASIDRYIQRKILIDQKEKEKALEQKEYEQSLRERNLRAARNGTEFKDMTRREEAAKKKKMEKIAEEKAKQEAKERAEKLARKKAIAERLNRPASKNELTWKEMEEQQDIRRKERAERFKQELLMTVNSEGNSLANNNTMKEKALLLQKEQEEKDKLARKFVATDPAKVAARLEQTRRAYELQQQRKQEYQELLKETRKEQLNASHNIPVVKSMEERDRQYQEKKRKKEKEMKEKAVMLAKKKAEEEERARRRLLHAKIPEASRRWTRSAVARTELVKTKKEEEAAESQRQEKEKLRKSQQEKELAAVLRADLREREDERKSKVTGYVELQGTKEKAAAAAALARKQYRENLRQNRARIADKLKDRPSLMERHDQDLRKRAAGTKALETVADTMNKANKSELLNNEEKMRLGIDSDDESLGI